MSTRAHIVIMQKGSENVNLFHHCDGYPSGVGSELASFLKDAPSPWNPEVLKYFICGRDDDYRAVEKGPSWDSEYVYIIDCDHGTLKCYGKGIETPGAETFDIDCPGSDELLIPDNPFDGYKKAPVSFYDRLIIERDELKSRLGKLERFLDTPKYEELQPIDRSLLREQEEVMARYLNILERRIMRLEK